jgi:hypothetical protein
MERRSPTQPAPTSLASRRLVQSRTPHLLLLRSDELDPSAGGVSIATTSPLPAALASIDHVPSFAVGGLLAASLCHLPAPGVDIRVTPTNSVVGNGTTPCTVARTPLLRFCSTNRRASCVSRPLCNPVRLRAQNGARNMKVSELEFDPKTSMAIVRKKTRRGASLRSNSVKMKGRGEPPNQSPTRRPKSRSHLMGTRRRRSAHLDHSGMRGDRCRHSTTPAPAICLRGSH